MFVVVRFMPVWMLLPDRLVLEREMEGISGIDNGDDQFYGSVSFDIDGLL